MIEVNEHIFLSFLAVLTLLCTACITGGWEECPEPDELDNPNNLIIHLGLVTYAESTDDWQNATLFVLTKDQDGKDSVVATRPLDVPQPKKISVRELGLKLSTDTDSTAYSFVVWFNLKEKASESDNELEPEPPYTYILDKDTTVYMQLPEIENGSITIRNTMDSILPFFHGFKEQHWLHSNLGENNEVTIPVISQTNELNIKVFGANVKPKPESPDERYRFLISDKSGKYSLRNEFLERPESFYYVSDTIPDINTPDTVRTTMRILKLFGGQDGRELLLTVGNDSRQVFGSPDETSLAALILQSWQISHPGEPFDISQHPTFNIDIELDGARNVTITVNDWGEVEWNNEIDLDL